VIKEASIKLAFCVQFYSLILVSPGVVYRGFFVGCTGGGLNGLKSVVTKFTEPMALVSKSELIFIN
jgi:hypothetical protein